MGSSQEGSVRAGTVWTLPGGKLWSATSEFWNSLGGQGSRVAVQLEGNPVFRERAARYLIEIAPASYEFAIRVLDQDMVEPDSFTSTLGVAYTDEQLKHFMYTLPPVAMIHKIGVGRNFMLIAGPPEPLSLSDIVTRHPAHFSKGTVRDCRLNVEHVVGTGWIALRKTEVPGSLSASWGQAVALLSGREYVPNAAEVAWCVLVYKAVRGVTLLPEVCVRTFPVNFTDYCISVGDSAFGGIQVAVRLKDALGAGVGLASALKLWQ